MSDKCKTCGGSGKISKYVKSILGEMEYPCPDCNLAEQGLSLETIIARILEPLACNTGLPNFDACRDICKIAASQATEIETKTEFIKGLKENNSELAKTIADLKKENDRLNAKIKRLETGYLATGKEV